MKWIACILLLLALLAFGGGKTGDTDLAEEAAFQTPTPVASETPFDAVEGSTSDGSDPTPDSSDGEEADGPGATHDEDGGNADDTPGNAPSKPNRNVEVPNVVGYNLAKANELLAEDGFVNVAAADIHEDLRPVEKDSDWKVCRQTPDPGEYGNPRARINLGVVKTNEECP